MEFINSAPTVCIPLIVGVLTIAFPLLLQSVARIDDKYSSTKIVSLFYSEKISIISLITLIVTLICLGIWILGFQNTNDYGSYNYIVDNSAIIILSFFNVVLIVFLFLFLFLTIKYYNPITLLNHLIYKHNKIKFKTEKKLRLLNYFIIKNNTNKKNHFEAISDLLYFSIQQQNEDIAKELFSFFTTAFVEFRIDKKGKEVVFPDEYYVMMIETNERICLRKKKTTSYFNNNTLLDLFLDGYQGSIQSEKNYSVIWKCLVQAVEYERDDIVFSYWKNAHQHFIFFMDRIPEEYEGAIITNGLKIKDRDIQIQRFLEFHYALGGLLMYRKRYNLLGRIAYHTNQKPPKYVLFPDTISNVIMAFMSFPSSFLSPFYFESRYYFPDISGIDTDDIIRVWIKKYIAFLLLRQYTMHDYLGKNTMDLPNNPNTIKELNIWNQEIKQMKYLINDLLKNSDLLSETKIPEFTEEWLTNNNKLHPIKLIDALAAKINEDYDRIEIEQTISNNKQEQFKQSTKEIITKVISNYRQINNTGEINEDSISYWSRGRYQVLDKKAFAENQDISHANFDSIIASAVAMEYSIRISESFYFALNKKRYILKSEDVFIAIDRLKLDSKKFVIISFGIYFDFYIHSLKIKNLIKSGDNIYLYNELKILNYNTCNWQTVGNTFFVLNIADLPRIESKIISPEKEAKFRLTVFEDLKKNGIFLYTGVVDLNEEKELREEVSLSVTDSDLTKCVIASVVLDTEIKWKKDVKCIGVKIYDQFDDRGTPNGLDEFDTFSEMTKIKKVPTVTKIEKKEK